MAMPFDPEVLAVHCGLDGATGLAGVTAQGPIAATDMEQLANFALFDQGIHVMLISWIRAVLLPLPVASLLGVLSVVIPHLKSCPWWQASASVCA